MKKLMIAVVFMGAVLNQAGAAKNVRFEKDIQAFEAKDSKQMPPQGGILFLGSSSIRGWWSLTDDMAGLQVLNRGFGGSTIPDILAHYKRIVPKYQPSQIVFYCGENDIAGRHTPQRVLDNFKQFMGQVRLDLGNIPVYYISMKPSPRRWKLWPKMVEGNKLIEAYCKSKPNLTYIDSGNVMLKKDGTPDKSIFVKDMLHMNREGYKRWTKMVRDHLDKKKSK